MNPFDKKSTEENEPTQDFSWLAEPETSQFYAPPGGYKYVVRESSYENNKHGEAQIKLSVELVEGDEQGVGIRIFDYVTFFNPSRVKPGALNVTRNKARGVGLTLENANSGTLRAEAPLLVGRVGMCTVGDWSSDRGVKSQITRYEPYDPALAGPSDSIPF